MHIRFVALFAIAGAALIGAAVAAPGGGSSGGGSYNAPQREMTPEGRAQTAFRQGVRAVKQAEKQESAAGEAATEGKRAKAQERARSQYEKARESFTATVQQAPDNHEAWNYLGYASRKLGLYNDSLAAYDEMLPRVRAVPGVEAASAVLLTPFSGTGGWDGLFVAADRPATEQRSNPWLNMEVVSPSYFDVFRVPLRDGRVFSEADRQGAPPAIRA